MGELSLGVEGLRRYKFHETGRIGFQLGKVSRTVLQIGRSGIILHETENRAQGRDAKKNGSEFGVVNVRQQDEEREGVILEHSL